MNIDWSKAPEGATHYLPEDEDHFACWVKLGYTMKAGMQSKWVRDELESVVHLLIARPAPWNGEGLPPVGTVCEVCSDLGSWEVCTVLAHNGSDVVFVDAEGIYGGLDDLCRFRPLRTPEQIAEEEQNKAVSEMMTHVVHATPIDCELLYRAGYRKQEQTK